MTVFDNTVIIELQERTQQKIIILTIYYIFFNEQAIQIILPKKRVNLFVTNSNFKLQEQSTVITFYFIRDKKQQTMVIHLSCYPKIKKT